jgi:hypothetical protein
MMRDGVPVMPVPSIPDGGREAEEVVWVEIDLPKENGPEAGRRECGRVLSAELNN